MEKDILKLIRIQEYFIQNGTEKGIRLLEEIVDQMRRESFIQGYEYAITILQESLIRQPNDG